jgi:hypothetical protein
VRAEKQADRDCAAKGLAAGGSALAECVLRETDSTVDSPTIETASLSVTPYTPTAVPDSSNPASRTTRVRRNWLGTGSTCIRKVCAGSPERVIS